MGSGGGGGGKLQQRAIAYGFVMGMLNGRCGEERLRRRFARLESRDTVMQTRNVPAINGCNAEGLLACWPAGWLALVARLAVQKKGKDSAVQGTGSIDLASQSTLPLSARSR